MNIFLSWSGEASQRIAQVFSEWLPLVIQPARPFMSTDDISKGSNWSNELKNSLREAAMGIVFVTSDNMNTPWINFECGAIAHALGDRKVCPVLFGMQRYELIGPLSQFQTTLLDETDVLRLVQSINTALDTNRLTDSVLEKTFKVFWPQLSTEVNSVPSQMATTVEPSKSDIAGALSQMRKMLERLNRHSEIVDMERPLRLRSPITSFSQRDALANISHELRTPLTVLAGFVETLQAITLSDADQKRVFDLMANQTARLQDIVGRIWVLHENAPPTTTDA